MTMKKEPVESRADAMGESTDSRTAPADRGVVSNDPFSPLPWQLTDGTIYSMPPGSHACSPVAVVDCCEHGLLVEDAAFIVRACNAHADLLAALKLAHACATLMADGTCGGCPVSDAIAKAETHK